MSVTVTYTSAADFEAYVEGWVTDNPDALARLLQRAERDVDAILGPVPRRQLSTTGLKLDPTVLRDWEARALSRAVCAQAEWRFYRGEAELAAGRQTKIEQGPDFKVEYADGDTKASGLYAPKLRVELEPIAHLRRLSARLV